MKYSLNLNERISLKIHARAPFSEDYLVVKENEEYLFNVDPDAKWTDWFIRSNANGFNNLFLLDRCKRVSGHKCFKLCGTIGVNESKHFGIGVKKLWKCENGGNLFFFANDSRNQRFYKNNRGSIEVSILRLK